MSPMLISSRWVFQGKVMGVSGEDTGHDTDLDEFKVGYQG